jgi:hypothetical protein
MKCINPLELQKPGFAAAWGNLEELSHQCTFKDDNEPSVCADWTVKLIRRAKRLQTLEINFDKVFKTLIHRLSNFDSLFELQKLEAHGLQYSIRRDT